MNGFMPIMGGFIGILLMFGIIAAYVIIIVAAWRLMRAHESLAESLRDIALSLRNKSKEP